MHLIDEDEAGSYRTLLEGLDSADEEAVLIAVHLVALLRGEGSVNPETATPQEKAEAIEAHRAWLEQKIRETQGQEPAAEGPAETSPEEDEEASEDSPVEEAPQQTGPEED